MAPVGEADVKDHQLSTTNSTTAADHERTNGHLNNIADTNATVDVIYQPLNRKKREFRLLLLHAGQGDEPVRAELQYAQCAKEPRQYETISYCWKDPTDKATIEIDSKNVAIPASSAAAVRCVRLPDRNRVVWIDAICINQEDLDERAQQVAMMADIYSKSAGNLVYLGEADAERERAVWNLNKVIADVKERTKDFRRVKGTPFDRESYNISHSFFDDVSCGVDQESLYSFFANDWFRRVWAFQEAGLSPSNLCFIGHLRLDLLDVVRAARWIWFQRTTFQLIPSHHRGLRCAVDLENYVDKEFGPYSSSHRPPLSALLNTSKSLLASDPRDHLYGLLGLWDGLCDGADLPISLAPDYRKEIAHIFRDGTRAALEDELSLDLWGQISHRHERDISSDSIPSWALKLDKDFLLEQDAVLPGSNFRAHGGCLLQYPTICPTDDNAIMLHGLVFDEVVDVTSTLKTRDYYVFDSITSWVQEVVDMAKTGARHMTEDDIGSTLLAGHSADNLTQATREDVRGFFELRWILNYEHRLPTEIEDVTAQTPPYELQASRFYWRMENACRNRRFCVTKTEYMGIGPKLTQPGDIVVILHGGQWPFVLRPCGEDYRLVGACYIEGVMQGEAMKKYKQRWGPDIEFRIR